MTEKIKEAFLRAESPKSAWYRLVVKRIFLAQGECAYVVVKQSGIEPEKCLHEETYFRENLDRALQLYERRLAEKLNTKRKNPRKYRLVEPSASSS